MHATRRIQCSFDGAEHCLESWPVLGGAITVASHGKVILQRLVVDPKSSVRYLTWRAPLASWCLFALSVMAEAGGCGLEPGMQQRMTENTATIEQLIPDIIDRTCYRKQ